MISDKKHVDSKLLMDTGLKDGSEINLSVTNEATQTGAGSTEDLDFSSFTKDGKAFIKVKDDKGQEVLK